MFGFGSIVRLGSAALNWRKQPRAGHSCTGPSRARLSLETLSDRLLPSVDVTGFADHNLVQELADPDSAQVRFVEIPTSDSWKAYVGAQAFPLSTQQVTALVGGASGLEQLGPPSASVHSIELGGDTLRVLDFPFGSSIMVDLAFEPDATGSVGARGAAAGPGSAPAGGPVEVSSAEGEIWFLMVDHSGEDSNSQGISPLPELLSPASPPWVDNRPTIGGDEPTITAPPAATPDSSLATSIAGWWRGQQITDDPAAKEGDDRLKPQELLGPASSPWADNRPTIGGNEPTITTPPAATPDSSLATSVAGWSEGQQITDDPAAKENDDRLRPQGVLDPARSPWTDDRSTIGGSEPAITTPSAATPDPTLATSIAGWSGAQQIADALAAKGVDAWVNGTAEVAVNDPGNPADVLLTLDTVLPDAKADLIRLQNADLAIVPTYLVGDARDVLDAPVAPSQAQDRPDTRLIAQLVGLDELPGDVNCTPYSSDQMFELPADGERDVEARRVSADTGAQLGGIDDGEAPDAISTVNGPSLREWLDGFLHHSGAAVFATAVLGGLLVMHVCRRVWRLGYPNRASQSDRIRLAKTNGPLQSPELAAFAHEMTRPPPKIAGGGLVVSD